MKRLQQLVERDQWAEFLTEAQSISNLTHNSDIEIMAFSHKEAVKKAAHIYGIPSKFFTCREEAKGSSGMLGWFRIPSRFVASLKPEAREMLDVGTDYQKNDLAQNKNGSYRIQMRKPGLEIIVFKALGIGKPVSVKEIEAELLRRNITSYNVELVAKAVKEPERRVIIAPYVRSDNDSTFSVHTDKNNMHAYFSFTQPKSSTVPDPASAAVQHIIGRIPETDEVVDALKQIGVTFGISEDIISDVLDNNLHDIPIVVAEGTPVEDGANGFIEYTFPTGADQFKHAVLSDGSVNFRELNIIHNVHKGDVLAVMHPPTPGTPGCNLLGEVIMPNSGKEVLWNLGDNVELSADRLQALAASTGQVYLKNGQICVDTALEIGGDLDLTVGNIDFVGNVIIKGNVDDGFTVISGGNIEIHGHIGKSFIRAEGNIIAHRGIQGKDEAKIECKGSLYAKFVERAHLNIGANLVVTDYILHSSIFCDENVIVAGGKRAMIAGGSIKVQGNIYAMQVGAESYTDTSIEVGYPARSLRDLQALQSFVKEKAEQIEAMKNEIQNLAGRVSPARMVKMEATLHSAQNRYNDAMDKMQVIHNEIRKIQNQAFLSVEKRLMPGVKLFIGDSILENTAEQSGASFRRKDKNIVAEAYIPPNLLTSPEKLSANKKKR